MAAIGAADGRVRRYLGPYNIARYCTAAALAACVAFVWLSLAMPVTDASFAPAAEPGRIFVVAGGRAFEADAETNVAFRPDGGGTLSLTAGELASVDAAISAERGRLAAALGDGTVRGVLIDIEGVRRDIAITARPAHLTDLNATYWLVLIFGLVGFLFAVGVWAVRPRDEAAILYFWTGVLLLASSCTDALFELWSLATPVWAAVVILTVNVVILNPFALLFVVLFARFPKRLVPSRIMVPAMWAAGAAAVVTAAMVPVFGTAPAGALQGAAYLALLILVLVQFWVGRKDPAARQAVTVLVTVIVTGIALYALTTVLPTIRGEYAPLQEVIAFPLFILIYGGIGLAVVRTGLFALDGWVRNVMVSVAVIAAALVIDLALLGWLVQQQSVALGLSFAAVALVYLPVREGLARRAQRRRMEQNQTALQKATDLVFATGGEDRGRRWSDAVAATFQPLEIAPDPAPAAAPKLGEGGATLRLPAVEGAPGLICRHADAGRRAFGPGDVEAARALVAIVERLGAARDAYVQGVAEERQRIARDLHDDVSGRLAASLHRRDHERVHMDVREAIADIRTIVSGLAGKPRRLGDLLAELRYDSIGRCEGAGVALDWPPGPELADERPLDYRVYRHLMAAVRESVSNILRHSGATRARIACALDGERLSVTIIDNGCGLPPEVLTDGRAGNGLRNCTVRAEALGGRFEIAPTEQGAAVRFDGLNLAPAG